MPNDELRGPGNRFAAGAGTRAGGLGKTSSSARSDTHVVPGPTRARSALDKLDPGAGGHFERLDSRIACSPTSKVSSPAAQGRSSPSPASLPSGPRNRGNSYHRQFHEDSSRTTSNPVALPLRPRAGWSPPASRREDFDAAPGTGIFLGQIEKPAAGRGAAGGAPAPPNTNTKHEHTARFAARNRSGPIPPTFGAQSSHERGALR